MERGSINNNKDSNQIIYQSNKIHSTENPVLPSALQALGEIGKSDKSSRLESKKISIPHLAKKVVSAKKKEREAVLNTLRDQLKETKSTLIQQTSYSIGEGYSINPDGILHAGGRKFKITLKRNGIDSEFDTFDADKVATLLKLLEGARSISPDGKKYLFSKQGFSSTDAGGQILSGVIQEGSESLDRTLKKSTSQAGWKAAIVSDIKRDMPPRLTRELERRELASETLKEQLDSLDKIDEQKIKTILKNEFADEFFSEKTIKDIAIATHIWKSKKLDQSSAILAKHLHAIERKLTETPSGGENFAKINKSVMRHLRKALETDAYQLIKYDEKNPAVRLLHDLAVAKYLKPPVVEVYKKFGEEVVQGFAGVKPKKMEHTEITEHLETFREHLHRGGIFKSDKTAAYVFEHTSSTRGALMSEKYSLGLGNYDPHVDMENNPGPFFEKTFAKNSGKTANARHFFSPAWRFKKGGFDVPSEAHAILQSMENRKYQTVENDTHPARMIVYENAQNLTQGPEAKSSAAIMQLNEQYPDSFLGYTFAFDSKFVKRGLGHGSKMWDKIEPDPASTSQEFAEALKKQLLDVKAFQQTAQGKEGSGYHFPPAFEEHLHKHIDSLVDYLGKEYQNLYEMAKTAPDNKKYLWKVQSAMIEEANLVLSYIGQNIGAEKSGGDIAIVSVCKELADRGKMRNLLHYYATAGDEKGTLSKEEIEVMQAVSESRPLMTRSRLGLSHRNQSGYALMELRSPAQIRASIVQVAEITFSKGKVIS